MVATVNKMGKDERNERNDTSLLILEDMERDSSPRSSMQSFVDNSEKEELITEERKMAQTSEMKDAKINSDDNSRIDLHNIKPENESYSKSNHTRSKTPEQLNLKAYVEKLIA